MLPIDFAPMEGITGYAFRNAHCRTYGGISRYFTPFITVNQNCLFKKSEERDVLPENNSALHGSLPADPASREDRLAGERGTALLVPQLLTGHGDQLLWGVRTLYGMGYREINWNLGCPSPTVTKRGRGAGLLAEPDRVDWILDAVFEGMEREGLKASLSIKMRPGLDSNENFPALMEVINRYPLDEIILHPRLAARGYGGAPDEEVFAEATAACRHPLIWNGDDRSPADAARIRDRFPTIADIMIGRGLLIDPALAEEIAAAEPGTEAGQGSEKGLFPGGVPAGGGEGARVKGGWQDLRIFT